MLFLDADWSWDWAPSEAAPCCWQQVSSFHLTFCAWHVSGVIMEPHCVPAARESAGLCLIALQSSRPQAAFPRSAHTQKCMINCSNGLKSQIQGVTLVSIGILLLHFQLTSLHSSCLRLLFSFLQTEIWKGPSDVKFESQTTFKVLQHLHTLFWGCLAQARMEPLSSWRWFASSCWFHLAAQQVGGDARWRSKPELCLNFKCYITQAFLP